MGFGEVAGLPERALDKWRQERTDGASYLSGFHNVAFGEPRGTASELANRPSNTAGFTTMSNSGAR
jgi:hypothetical protein